MTTLAHTILKKRRSVLFWLISSTLGIHFSWAQQTTLYDPQPPANSAYVRIIWGAANGAFSVSVNNKKRLSDVPPNTPTSYMILPAGKHDITVQAGRHVHKIPVHAESSRAITIVLTQNGHETNTTTIEDTTNSNRFKAIISAYHLGGAPAVDVTTADGKTPIFTGLAAGASVALVVNPISLRYMLSPVGSQESIASDELKMKSGAAYSIVIFKDKAGKIQASSFENMVERYQN